MKPMFETNANALADIVKQIEALKSEKKLVLADYNGRIASLEQDMFNLADELKKDGAGTLFETVIPEVVPNPGPDDNPEPESSPCTPTDNPLQISAPDENDDERTELNLGESKEYPDNSFLESDLAGENDSFDEEDN